MRKVSTTPRPTARSRFPTSKAKPNQPEAPARPPSLALRAGWLTNMILLIDNYDSFTYNLVQRLGEMDPNIDLRVYRNDQITVDEIAALAPSHLIISPGPCTPREA